MAEQPAPTTTGDQTVASNTSGTQKDANKSDDKCIGNRRVRTILLCGVLLAFSIFAIGFLFYINKNVKDLPSTTDTDGMVHASNFFISGLFFIMFFCLLVIILLFIPSCDPVTNQMARLPGIGLLLGSGLYIFGWIWFISAQKSFVNYSSLSDDDKQRMDAQWLGQFGEALLYAATSILIGIDLLIPSRHLFHNEYRRLFMNLGVLAAVSILCMPAYFIQHDDGKDGVILIAIGYLFICIVSLTYIILFITTCCTCDCKDLLYVRVILGLGLVLGGVLGSIGYYIYAGGSDKLGDSDDEAKRVAYYIGYTILVAGLTGIWALDILWDDIKGNNK